MAWPVPTCARMRSMVVWMKCSGVQSGLAPQMVDDEVLQQLHALAGVRDLRVELHRPDAALFVGDAGEGVGGPRGEGEAVGQLLRFVAVAHPDGERTGKSVEEEGLVDDIDLGVAVLAGGRGFDLAAEVVHDELQPVADAEDGDAEREHGGIGGGSIGVIDRARAAGEDDAQRIERAELIERRGAGKHDGEDVELADAARDELGVLRTEVENDDC